MTPFPHAVALDAALSEAERLFADHDINHLPVTDQREIVGLVTKQGVMTAGRGVVRGAARVGDITVTDPYVVDLNLPLETVVTAMADRHIDCAIVTRQGRLAGIFTWVDACRSFGALLRARHPPPGGRAA